jgi:hypothetical protein
MLCIPFAFTILGRFREKQNLFVLNGF